MGIPTLISTTTASNAANISITSGIDSTYDEYMFVLTDIGPATNGENFLFDTSTDGGSNYASTATTTYFRAKQTEDNSESELVYQGGSDLAQGTGGKQLASGVGGDADESCAGILYLFSSSNSTYIKHYYGQFSDLQAGEVYDTAFVAGYINQTADIDAIKFYMGSGNLDGVVQMYGIS